MGANGRPRRLEGQPAQVPPRALNEYPHGHHRAKKTPSYLKDVGIGTTLQIMTRTPFDMNYSAPTTDLIHLERTADIDPGYILSTFTTPAELKTAATRNIQP